MDWITLHLHPKPPTPRKTKMTLENFHFQYDIFIQGGFSSQLC